MDATGGRRAERVEHNRERILTAARERLIHAGYHDWSLDRIAADVGLTRVTIYRQFGSKLGLLDAVAEALARRTGLVARVDAAVADPDPVAAFRALVTEICRFWASDPALLRRFVTLGAVDPRAADVIAERDRWRQDHVTAVVRRLVEEDRILAPFDATRAAALVAAFTSFPTYDDLATRLGHRRARLTTLLLDSVRGIVRLS